MLFQAIPCYSIGFPAMLFQAIPCYSMCSKLFLVVPYDSWRCYSMLFLDIPCYSMRLLSMLFWVIPSYSMMFQGIPCYSIGFLAMWFQAIPCYSMLYLFHTVACHSLILHIWCAIFMSHPMLFHVIPCYTIWFHPMPWSSLLFHADQPQVCVPIAYCVRSRFAPNCHSWYSLQLYVSRFLCNLDSMQFQCVPFYFILFHAIPY